VLTSALTKYIHNHEVRDIIVESLLELSFHTEDIAELRRDLISLEDTRLISLLQEAKQLGCFEAGNLLFRLTLDPPEEHSRCDLLGDRPQQLLSESLSQTTNTDAHSTATPLDTANKHIMLSYSWRFGKEKVVALASALRGAGFDVWRDEEGSSVMHPMGGCADDTMAKAVEKSFLVICCISRHYKESPNCRSEAQYAKLLWQQGKSCSTPTIRRARWHSPTAGWG
jgi:hypothetical protein